MLKAIAFDLEMVPFNMRTLYDPKHPEVLRINPKRQVPVLIDGAVELFDSTQIFEYLEDGWPAPALWPSPAQDRAQARLLELKSDEVFFPHVIRLMGLRGAGEHPDAGPSRDGIEGFYRDIDRLLEDREFLAGSYSYADIAFFMAQFFAARMAVPMPVSLSHLLAWRRRIARRPAVRRVIDPMVDFLRLAGRPVPAFD